jgi:hypothetical protein
LVASSKEIGCCGSIDESEESDERLPPAAFNSNISTSNPVSSQRSAVSTSAMKNDRTDRANNQARRSNAKSRGGNTGPINAKSRGGDTGPMVSLLQSEHDYYLSKGVAFEFDSTLFQSIVKSFKVSFAKRNLVMNHLVGDVVRRSTGRGGRAGQLLYDVAWRFSAYGETTLANSYISDGIERYKQLGLDNKQTPSKQRILSDPYLNSGIKRIVQTSFEEETYNMSAVSSESDSCDSDSDVLGVQSHFDILAAFQKDNAYIPELLQELSDDETETNVATLDGLEWIPNGKLPPKAMDVVDRHEQYRSKFYMCKYHGFKKYYVKL